MTQADVLATMMKIIHVRQLIFNFFKITSWLHLNSLKMATYSSGYAFGAGLVHVQVSLAARRQRTVVFAIGRCSNSRITIFSRKWRQPG